MNRTAYVHPYRIHEHALCEGSAPSYYISGEQPHDLLWLRTVKGQYILGELSISFTGPGESVSTAMAIFKATQHGCRCWHSLPDVCKALRLQLCGGKSSKWVDERWDAWGRLCVKMGLDMIHLRRSVSYDVGGQVVEPSPLDLTAIPRVLPWRCASTVCLLCLLAHWSQCSRVQGGFKNENDRSAAEDMLNQLIDLISCDDWTMDIRIDPDVHYIGGVRVFGDKQVDVIVWNGVMDLLELFRHATGPCSDKSAFKALCSLGDGKHLPEQTVFQMKRVFFKLHAFPPWLQTQLLCSVGHRLDEFIATQHDKISHRPATVPEATPDKTYLSASSSEDISPTPSRTTVNVKSTSLQEEARTGKTIMAHIRASRDVFTNAVTLIALLC